MDIILEQLGVSRELIRYVDDRLGGMTAATRLIRRSWKRSWCGSRSILLTRDLLRLLIGTGRTKLVAAFEITD